MIATTAYPTGIASICLCIRPNCSSRCSKEGCVEKSVAREFPSAMGMTLIISTPAVAKPEHILHWGIEYAHILHW
jgi:hypothetical protein